MSESARDGLLRELRVLQNIIEEGLLKDSCDTDKNKIEDAATKYYNLVKKKLSSENCNPGIENLASSKNRFIALQSSAEDYRPEKSVSDKEMDMLLQQNALLEIEVTTLCAELDELTKGILKRGYLYKWRDREISYASKWGLRYFELKGSTIFII